MLICEPHPDVRSLLAFVVRRVGHEPVVSDGTREQALAADALLIEPGGGCLELATWVRKQRPLLPIICTSIFPPAAETTTALRPDAYLVKPFPLYELEQALVCALARRGSACAAG